MRPHRVSVRAMLGCGEPRCVPTECRFAPCWAVGSRDASPQSVGTRHASAHSERARDSHTWIKCGRQPLERLGR